MVCVNMGLINDSDLFSCDYLLSYCLESLSYSAWFTMCLTYRRLSLKLMKAMRRRLFSPLSMTHHLSSCVKLSSDGNTFLRLSGRLKMPLHKTLYVRSIAAASFGYLAAASRKGFLDITCNIFSLPKVSFLEKMRETLSLCQDGTSYAAKKRVLPHKRGEQGGGSSPDRRGPGSFPYRRSQSSSQDKRSIRRIRPTGGGHVVQSRPASWYLLAPASGGRRRASVCCDGRQRTS